MVNIPIRNPDDAPNTRRPIRAATRGRVMKKAQAVYLRVATLGRVDLDTPPREPLRTPPAGS
ncbi:MAG: plasmid stabilization protein [Alphaproteobacteria bacterium]|nr:MAG: plasmid stabilization protein [Alphaproteobacteria bacterium]